MEKEQLILLSAQEFNILPLTSYCDAKCIFCSHRHNPEEVRIVTIPPRSLADVERTLAFLDGRKKITIGESATMVIEGEPFSHPEFHKIIEILREKFSRTVIAITTNGHGLDEKTVAFLKKVEPVEINLSLNSATERGRRLLMGDNPMKARQAINGVKLLAFYGIPYHGSIVAMPQLVGWEDIAETIFYLAENGTMTIRIFMAGYSFRNPCPALDFDSVVLHEKLAHFIKNMADKVSCPLLLEPPDIDALIPLVGGVIKGSKADLAGIKRGDLVEEVNGVVPRSRVEAWSLLQQPGDIKAVIQRQSLLIDLTWHNDQGKKPGVVMEYDFDMKRMEKILGIVLRYQGPVLLLCSELGFHILQAVLKLPGFSGVHVNLKPVKNKFFGGSIRAAGLLTVGDFMKAYQEYQLFEADPALILLPEESFDRQGYDLTGHPFWEIEECTGIQAMIV